MRISPSSRPCSSVISATGLSAQLIRLAAPARLFTGADNQFIRTRIALGRTDIARNLTGIPAIGPGFPDNGIDIALDLTGTAPSRPEVAASRTVFTDFLPEPPTINPANVN